MGGMSFGSVVSLADSVCSNVASGVVRAERKRRNRNQQQQPSRLPIPPPPTQPLNVFSMWISMVVPSEQYSPWFSPLPSSSWQWPYVRITMNTTKNANSPSSRIGTKHINCTVSFVRRTKNTRTIRNVSTPAVWSRVYGITTSIHSIHAIPLPMNFTSRITTPRAPTGRYCRMPTPNPLPTHPTAFVP